MSRATLERFFFAPASLSWVAVLRCGMGLQLILFCLALRPSWIFLLGAGGRGFLGSEISSAWWQARGVFVPHLGWLAKAFGEFPAETALHWLWLLLLLSGLFLLLGLFTRGAAISGWLLHLLVAKSSGLLSYGVDSAMTIGLFYLVLAPTPDRWTLDHRFGRAVPPAAPILIRRALQIHLCLLYFFSGLAKALGPGWWNGNSLWRALVRPPFDLLPPDGLAALRFLLPAAGIALWLLELTFPLMIWPRRTRPFWLAAICLLHLGIGLLMGMPLFASAMIVLNLAAFAPERGATAAPAAR